MLKGFSLDKLGKVDTTVIFACGKGERMKPLTFDTPKPLLKVKSEVLIERQIQQLKEKNITDIYVVVGYLDEKFKYLTDKYNVKLIYNEDFLIKDSLYTLHKASQYLRDKNFYICNADIYLTNNIFENFEIETNFKVFYCDNSRGEALQNNDCRSEALQNNECRGEALQNNNCSGEALQNNDCRGEALRARLGFAYFDKVDGEKLLQYCDELIKAQGNEKMCWEDIIEKYQNEFSHIKINQINDMYAFDNIDDIKNFDNDIDTGCKSIEYIKKVFNVTENDIVIDEITTAGLTNYSYVFNIVDNDKKYLMRVPGNGTDNLINRKLEAQVLNEMDKYDIAEKVIYIDENTGYKISEFIEDGKIINTDSEDDLKFAMAKLKELHNINIDIKDSKNLFDWVEMYETAIKKDELHFPFDDHDIIKQKIDKLCDDIRHMCRKQKFCHGDANPSNMLITKGTIKFIDFEYVNIFDQAFEIAMFALNAGYKYDKIFTLVDYYISANPQNDVFENMSKAEADRLVIKYFAISQYYCYLWGIVFQHIKSVDYNDYIISCHNKMIDALNYLERGQK